MKNWMVYAFGVVFFFIIFIVVIVMFVRGNGDNQQQTTQQNNTQQTTQPAESRLEQAKTTSGSQVVYTINGSVVANEERRSIRMTVSASERIVEILGGYQGDVLKTQRYTNTQLAFDAFIDALNGAGFEASQPSRNGIAEDKACPLGLGYQYQVKVPNKGDHYTWGTSCSRREGTFAGKSALVDTLFKQQFPDYATFTSGVSLRP